MSQYSHATFPRPSCNVVSPQSRASSPRPSGQHLKASACHWRESNVNTRDSSLQYTAITQYINIPPAMCPAMNANDKTFISFYVHSSSSSRWKLETVDTPQATREVSRHQHNTDNVTIHCLPHHNNILISNLCKLTSQHLIFWSVFRSLHIPHIS